MTTEDLEIKKEPLSVRLRTRIEREGPIRFRDWMQAALYDQSEGYYCRPGLVRQGRAGDYRTAPETSPLFAATFARYFSRLFVELGSPASWTIFEAGAASGEFAKGVLTTLRAQHPRIFAATNYVIDEVSADERLQAAGRLSDFAERLRFERLSTDTRRVEVGVVFSNELIDALPVHRITMRAGHLRELFVGVDQNKFVWVEGNPETLVEDYYRRTGLRLAEGQIAEVNLDAEGFISRVSAFLDRGFVITVDYGAERDELLSAPHRHQGTLRGFHRHQMSTDILARVGEQDLTTTIDWTQIREAGAAVGLKVLQHEKLDRFLLKAGLLDELEIRAAQLSEVDALRLRTSAREMIMPNGLAASFQILLQQKNG